MQKSIYSIFLLSMLSSKANGAEIFQEERQYLTPKLCGLFTSEFQKRFEQTTYSTKFKSSFQNQKCQIHILNDTQFKIGYLYNGSHTATRNSQKVSIEITVSIECGISSSRPTWRCYKNSGKSFYRINNQPRKEETIITLIGLKIVRNELNNYL